MGVGFITINSHHLPRVWKSSTGSSSSSFITSHYLWNHQLVQPSTILYTSQMHQDPLKIRTSSERLQNVFRTSRWHRSKTLDDQSAGCCQHLPQHIFQDEACHSWSSGHCRACPEVVWMAMVWQKKLNPVHVKMCVSALKTNSRLHPYWGAIDWKQLMAGPTRSKQKRSVLQQSRSLKPPETGGTAVVEMRNSSLETIVCCSETNVGN